MLSQVPIQDHAQWSGLHVLYFSLLPGQFKVNMRILDKS